jgi:hypothetical protein
LTFALDGDPAAQTQKEGVDRTDGNAGYGRGLCRCQIERKTTQQMPEFGLI